MSDQTERCPVCAANSGEARISPGPVIHNGRWWLVEHAYPSSLLGWIVIVLKRHAEALHQLSVEEGRELGLLQHAASISLHRMLKTAKEYSLCLGEAPHFSHLHFHVGPRPPDVREDRKGTQAFAYLKGVEDPVAPEHVSTFCEEFAAILDRTIGEIR